MQMLTFTHKLFRQRKFFNFLIPLFAVFVGLGASQTAQAQVTITSTKVIIKRNGGPNETLNANPNTPPAFDGADLGTYNINTGQLLLNGGTVTTHETGTITATAASLNYTVFDFNGNYLTSGSIPLQGGAATNGNRTYTTSGANIDLVNISRPVGAGTPYQLVVNFSTKQRENNRVANGPTDDNGGFDYVANYTITGAPVAPTSIGNSNVFIDQTGNQATGGSTQANNIYGASSSNTPTFQGANLGTYDINTGQLKLNGGDVTTVESNGDVVQNARLIYQIVKPVQPANGTSPATTTAIVYPPSVISLMPVEPATTSNGATTRKFANSTAFRNLIAGLANNGTGTFNLTVRYEADVLRNGSIITIMDPASGGYTATFNTVGVPILTDTWTGAVNDDWFTAGNWDLNRVPDANTNVVVPDFGTGNAKPYPNINAGVTFTTNVGTVKDNTNSGPALTRNLNLLGSTQAQRTILRLITGRLRIFGDFSNEQDSFIQRAGSVFELAGGNQSFTGGSNFDQVEISGGGIKTLTGTMIVAGSFTFLPDGGVVTTDVSRVNSNFIQFADRSQTAPNGAQLVGETETAYIRGFVFTNRSSVQANEMVMDPATGKIVPDPRTFGNLGMTLFFKGANNPGDVLLTRNTAESYTPLVPTSLPPYTATSRYGIRRIFGVRPSSPNTNNGGLLADVTFRYRDAELVNLGPDGKGSIEEKNLALFISTSGGNQFGYLGEDGLDQTNNILTKNNVRTFATFTLGDKTRPLPVSLTAFSAKRIGADALVSWETATELNNKGFDVQVSTDGKSFRTLGFVASETPNSVSLKSYSYVDVEKNKVGKRYYRLRQVDVNGKETFFAPAFVSFEGQVLEGAAMTAYPNPFGSADQLHLTLQSAVAGQGQMTITDMTGRLISQQKVDVTSGSNDVSVNRLNDLKAGLYMVRFVLPTGQVQNLKIQKQ